MVFGDALSRSGVTRVLDRMERDGLVRRKISATDRRRFDVILTSKGRRRFDDVWPAHEDGIRRYFADPLTQEDIDELARILSELIRSNEEAMGIAVDAGDVRDV
jgi:DNA-binding MarR family transcriptional regulator